MRWQLFFFNCSIVELTLSKVLSTTNQSLAIQMTIKLRRVSIRMGFQPTRVYALVHQVFITFGIAKQGCFLIEHFQRELLPRGRQHLNGHAILGNY
jgi:hypothetical protein